MGKRNLLLLGLAVAVLFVYAGKHDVQSGGKLVVESSRVSLAVLCYDETKSPSSGGFGATIQVWDGEIKVLEEAYTSSGFKLWNDETGLHAGQSLLVSCSLDDNDGAYENQVEITLKGGANAVDVPMKIIGDGRFTFYDTSGAAAVTLGGSDIQSISLDIDTDNDQEWYYRPVCGFKDSSGTVISRLSRIYASGAVEVSCDPYVLGGYQYCVQFSDGYVSSSSPLNGVRVYFQSGSLNPNGVLAYYCADAVPFVDMDGLVSVDRSDIYDTDGVSGTITVN